MDTNVHALQTKLNKIVWHFYCKRIKGTTIVARRAVIETLAYPAELQSAPAHPHTVPVTPAAVCSLHESDTVPIPHDLVTTMIGFKGLQTITGPLQAALALT